MRIAAVSVVVFALAVVTPAQTAAEQLIRRSRDTRLELASGRAVATGQSSWCLLREVSATASVTSLYCGVSGKPWKNVGPVMHGNGVAYLAADPDDDAVHALWSETREGGATEVLYARWSIGGADAEPVDLAAGEPWLPADLAVAADGRVVAGLIAAPTAKERACGVRMRAEGTAAFAPLLRVDEAGATALALAPRGWTLHILCRSTATPPLLLYRTLDLVTGTFRGPAAAVAPVHGSRLGDGPLQFTADALGRPQITYTTVGDGGVQALRRATDRGGVAWDDAVLMESTDAFAWTAAGGSITFATAADDYRSLASLVPGADSAKIASSPIPGRYAQIQSAVDADRVFATYTKPKTDIAEFVTTRVPAIGAVALGRPPADRTKAGRQWLESADAALAWLARHQDVDGHWDAANFMKHDTDGTPCDGAGNRLHDGGITGLAVLALLAGGHDGVRGVHAGNVRRALAWLASKQDGEGRVFVAHDLHYSNEFIYDHAIATLALCEACARAGEASLRPAARRAIDYLEAHRNPYGAWRYQPRDNDNDVSVTSWCIAAYEAARAAGFDVNAQAFPLVETLVDQLTDPTNGRCGYTQRGEWSARLPGDHGVRFPPDRGEALTAVALQVRFLLGQDPRVHQVMERAADTIVRKPAVWDVQAGTTDFYYWYYATRALHRIGGRHWAAWSAAIDKALVPHQRRDGNFAGSWDPIDVWGEVGGRVYTTALGALALLTVADARKGL